MKNSRYIGVVLFFFLDSQLGFAVQTLTRTQWSVYQVRSKLNEEIAGSKSNDFSAFSGSFSQDFTGFNRFQDSLETRISDQYDLFARVHPTLPRLESQNVFAIKKFLYIRPFRSNKFFFRAGRMSVPVASIRYHDGIDFGYNLNSFFKAGVFAGKAPLELYDTRSVTFLESYPWQAGVYGVFSRNSLHADAALSLQNALGGYSEREQGIYLHSGINYQIDDRANLISHIEMELNPQTALPFGYAGHIFTGEKLSSQTTIIFLTPDERLDLIPKDYPFGLASSEKLELSSDQMYDWFDSLAIAGNILYSKRLLDELDFTEIEAGSILKNIFAKNFRFYSYLGHVRDFYGQGYFIRLGMSYFTQKVNMHSWFKAGKERYEPLKIDIDRQDVTLQLDTFFDKILQSGLAVQYQKTTKSNAFAFLFTLSTYFGDHGHYKPRSTSFRFERF